MSIYHLFKKKKVLNSSINSKSLQLKNLLLDPSYGGRVDLYSLNSMLARPSSNIPLSASNIEFNESLQTLVTFNSLLSYLPLVLLIIAPLISDDQRKMAPTVILPQKELEPAQAEFEGQVEVCQEEEQISLDSLELLSKPDELLDNSQEPLSITPLSDGKMGVKSTPVIVPQKELEPAQAEFEGQVEVYQEEEQIFLDSLELLSKPNELLDNSPEFFSAKRSIRRSLKKGANATYQMLEHLFSLGCKKWLNYEKSLESNKLFKKFGISGRAGMLILLALASVLSYHLASLFFLKKAVKYTSKSIVSEISSNDVVIKAKNGVLEWVKARPFLRPVIVGICLGGIFLYIVFYVKEAIKEKVPYPGPFVPPMPEMDPCFNQRESYYMRRIQEVLPAELKRLEEENEVLPPHWPSWDDLLRLGVIDEKGRLIGFVCVCDAFNICIPRFKQ